MYRYSLLLAVLALCPMLPAESSRKSTAPAYTAASVVNSASNLADALAPNAIATIYGTDLSYGTSQASSGNIVNRMLPSVLAGVWEHGEHFALQVGIGQRGAIYARDNLCGRLLLRGVVRGCCLDGKRRRRGLLGLRGKNRKYEEDGD